MDPTDAESILTEETVRHVAHLARIALSDKEVKSAIDSNKELLVMCKAGGRSMMASELLSQENINCINISDGFEGNGEDHGWKNEGLPSK